jgi:AraC-like DNA-binding protein
LDPPRVIAGVGLDPHLFDDPEHRVPFRALGRLLEACVALTGCSHFGLLIGARFEIDSLGLLGLLMRHSPTVGDALRTATTHLELHDRGAVSLTLDLGSSRMVLGYSLFEGEIPGAEQILDGAIAMQCVLLRRLCGPSWKPLRVALSHRRPRQVAPLRRFFGPRLVFDARLSAIEFETRWLDHRIRGADPKTYAALVAAAESPQSGHAVTFAAEARRAIRAMIFTSSASEANLAHLFKLHPRTLRRKLRAEGASVRELVGEARRELAHHLLRDTALSVSEIAAVLGYSDVTVFARAFRKWATKSPREWRAALRPPP